MATARTGRHHHGVAQRLHRARRAAAATGFAMLSREAREIGAICCAVIGSFSVAMTAVQVEALIDDRAKVEIEVAAVIPK